MGRTPQRTTSTNGQQQQHRPHPRRLSFSAAEPKQQATVVAAIPPRTTEALAPAQEAPIKEEVVREVDLGKIEVDPAVREAKHAEGSRKSESEEHHAAPGEVDEAESLRQQGNAEYQAGRYDAAIELYSRSILANPRRSLSFSNRAAARLRTNDVQAAYQDALAALRLDPTNAKAHAHAGRCRFLMCNFGESQKSFEAGLALDPSDPAGLNAKGAHDCRRASGLLAECRRLVAERAHERALEQLDVLVREYPDLAPRPSVARTRAEIFEHLGLRLHDEGKFAEAAAALTSAIDLVENGVVNHKPGRSVCVEATSASQKEKEKSSNGLPALLANRASARKRLGDLPGALSDCLRCLALEPALLAARARLAHILVDLQEYDEALRLLDEAPPATSAAKFSDLDAAREQLGAERQYVNRTRADAQLRFFGGKDHARMLGLQLSPNGFPEAEVRQAFKRQALLWHPDKAPDAAVKELCAKVFRSVQASYQRLLDGWRPSPAAFPPSSSAQTTTAGTAAFRSRSTNSAAPGKPFAFGSSEYRRADAARAAASTYPQPTMFV